MSELLSHQEIVHAAFADPKNTAVTLPLSNVNKVIRTAYETDEPFTYTRAQLWDMEVKKARNPEKYLPHVVRPGSLKVYGTVVRDGKEFFTRVTDQRMWKNLDEFCTVVEQVCLDPVSMCALFVGVEQAVGPDGHGTIKAGGTQPVFHVEHGAAGSEDEPLNSWRIVHLTDGHDDDLAAKFDAAKASPYLRQFIEVYIEQDMGRKLTRKDLG